jgi:predicted metal-binding protein
MRSEQESVSICRSCPRYRQDCGSFGRAVADRLAGELNKRGVAVLMVTCLGSCKTPGAIALDAPRKDRIRVSDLCTADAEPLLKLVDAYLASPTGRLDLQHFPSSLRARVSAISPKINLNTACTWDFT